MTRYTPGWTPEKQRECSRESKRQKNGHKKRQGGPLGETQYIRSLIEYRQYEALLAESDRRGVTMNWIIREVLEERYNDSKRTD